MSSSEEQLLVKARDRSAAVLAALADEALRTPLALVCQPPPPVRPSAYGDVVPLGFLLRAINAAAPGSPVGRALEDLLRDKRQGLLWPYHSDTLVTCVDSAFVLQGFRDPAGVEALEIFADGRGWYLSQLCSDTPEPDTMTITPHRRFWCQADYGTTCLVSALRAEAGLTRTTSVQLLADAYPSRSGLYFSNPYMADWALAWALHGAPSGGPVRERLAGDLLASANEDGSFGTYDVPLSTALAILALTLLGVTGEIVRRARLRLADLVLEGSWQPSVPFYSAVEITGERLPDGLLTRLMLGESHGQLLWLDGGVYAVSLFVDGYHLIDSSLASLALTPVGPFPVGPFTGPEGPDVPTTSGGSCDARYRCPDQLAYLARYALPPYISSPAFHAGSPATGSHRVPRSVDT